MRPRVVLVAAVADGGVIGRNGAIPWHLLQPAQVGQGRADQAASGPFRVQAPAQLDDETLAFAKRVAMVPLDLLTLHKAAVNRFYEVMGIRAAEQSASDLDVIAHQTPAVKQWSKASRDKGLKGALKERDDRFAKRG